MIEIITEKVEMPEIKSWEDAIIPFRNAAKKSGLTPDDLNRIIEESKLKLK